MARFFPFFVCCGAEFCRGRGERLRRCRGLLRHDVGQTAGRLGRAPDGRCSPAECCLRNAVQPPRVRRRARETGGAGAETGRGPFPVSPRESPPKKNFAPGGSRRCLLLRRKGKESRKFSSSMPAGRGGKNTCRQRGAAFFLRADKGEAAPPRFRRPQSVLRAGRGGRGNTAIFSGRRPSAPVSARREVRKCRRASQNSATMLKLCGKCGTRRKAMFCRPGLVWKNC